MILVRDYMAAVEKVFGVRVAELKGSGRPRQWAQARWAVAMLARRDGYSWPEIGRALKKDHSSMIYGFKKGLELLREDDDYAEAVQAVRNLACQIAARRGKTGNLDRFRDWLVVDSNRVRAA